MKIYLAGPMRGTNTPDWNFSTFDRLAAQWQQAGHTAFNPAAMARALGYGSQSCSNPYPDSVEGRAHLKHVMLGDLAAIYTADAIVLIQGWESSKGATVEVALAQFLGLPVYCAHSMKELYVHEIPWIHQL